MSNSFKKSNLKKSKYDQGGIFMTIPPQRKKRKTIKIETEHTKKQKEEITKQNELKTQIEELEHRIKLELDQYNIVISAKKEELSKTEEKIKQISERNESLKLAIEKVQKEMELKLNKNKKKENSLINNNPEIKEEDPDTIKIKENNNLIENTRKTMEKYKQDINKLENAIFEDDNIKQINNIKFQIKTLRQRIDTLEKEKKYLSSVIEIHNKCLESQDNIQKDIDYYTRELNNLKMERNKEEKEKNEKLRNDMVVVNKNKQKLKEALLSPHELEKLKETKIKKTINEFWQSNKQKLLKYSLSDANININTIPVLKNKEKILKTDVFQNKDNNDKLNKKTLYKKKKNYAENLNNLNLDINTEEDPPLLPLFNHETRNILRQILPVSEIEKYEKRYECIDIEKKNLLRQYSLANKKFLRQQKNMKNQVEKNNERFKLNEAKNDKLNEQYEMKEKEYEKLKNKFNNIKRELNDKNQKIKIMNEENILMTQKYQSIRDKYIENNEKEKEKEKEKENDDEEGEEDEDEND